VVATMRTPEAETELTELDNVLVTQLDVTDNASIATAVAAAIERFGSIDALVNNAGYGSYGPLEATPTEKIRRQFDTNVMGLLETTKAVLPHFRAQHNGTIVNISSVGGRMTFPLGTLYHGTKWAVEGLSEALSFEMDVIGVKPRHHGFHHRRAPGCGWVRRRPGVGVLERARDPTWFGTGRSPSRHMRCAAGAG
jgi:NADP-dependent 3-hydroxy acid dehydrogenase YdfG